MEEGKSGDELLLDHGSLCYKYVGETRSIGTFAKMTFRLLMQVVA